MRGMILVLLGCVGLLMAGCHALDGKCDYIPPNVCGCSNDPFDPSYYNCNCKGYMKTENTRNRVDCGSCKCLNDTCSNCWSCGMMHDFHDQ